MGPMDGMGNSLMYRDNPCFKCTPETGRSPTCHTTCERHAEWVKAKDERRAKVGKHLTAERVVREHNIAVSDRINKTMKRK